MSIPAAVAQLQEAGSVRGTVVNSAGKLVGEASVRLEREGNAAVTETKTNPAGVFAFSALPVGSYQLTAQKSDLHSRSTTVRLGSPGEKKQVDLVLVDLVMDDSQPSTQAMEFADKPNFTVAGVTDWTAAGGHGSDSTLRTSEALARETLTLKPDASGHRPSGFPADPKDSNQTEGKLRAALAASPGNFAANHQLGAFSLHAGRYRESIPLLQAAYQIDPANRGNEYDLALAYKETGDFSQARTHVQKLLLQEDNADLHRMLGELDEKTGDPLASVHEDEQAVRLDPSEENYFAWGSELLLHRAVWQAAEVFKNGTKAYPKSARMLAAQGTALFAGALYDQAAVSLCAASDLNPGDPEPYSFMGRIEMAAPKPLPCVEPRLARFVQQQPANSIANYLYAMAIVKRQEQPADPVALHQVETLLTKAVAIDPKCGDAYLQLGILYFSQHQPEKAIHFYTQAIQADPQLGEAHYRLAVAYDRIGLPEKARQEFQLHDEIEKLQADAVERQRREVKQFLVVLEGQPGHPPPPK
ncbi:MAG TPA: tetratricopeptide repeat protein [Acidobacteriaceae bacterium]|nr:tetratricopeptide repeat protein [Acidobacteriaceae bacterium]